MTKSAEQHPNPPANAVALAGGWLSLSEATDVLKKSHSTIDRLTAAGLIKTRTEPRPGRKPERVYNEHDVREIARNDAERPKLQLMQRPAEPRQPMQLAIAQEAISSLHDVIREWGKHPRLSEKLWLSLGEAAEFSGLSEAFVLKQIVEGTITGIKAGPHGAWRIRRESLEAFNA